MTQEQIHAKAYKFYNVEQNVESLYRAPLGTVNKIAGFCDGFAAVVKEIAEKDKEISRLTNLLQEVELYFGQTFR